VQARTPEELEVILGEHLKRFRLSQPLDQQTLAHRAGISRRALQGLEAGSGSTLRTLVLVLRALGREGWLETVAPEPTINPLHLTRQAKTRQRAPAKRPAKRTD
jgi:transcriptional regulator with XRE-family HTH domain